MKGHRLAADGPANSLLEIGAEVLQARPSPSLNELSDLGQTRRHGDRVSREGSRLVNGAVRRKMVHDFRSAAECAHRQTASDHLAERGQIWHDVEQFLCAT